MLSSTAVRDAVYRQQFTTAEIAEAYRQSGGSYAATAKALTALGRGRVYRQIARNWVLALDDTEVPEEATLAAQSIKARNQQVNNSALRRELKALHDHIEINSVTLGAINEAAEALQQRPPLQVDEPHNPDGTPCTVELLLSDLQIGKLGAQYSTDIARARLFEYGRAARFQINQKIAAGYRVERIVLALLGDIIESDKKHKNSARATDSGTADQMRDAMEAIYELVIEPLARFGVQMDVICITGNHDHDDHGLMMWKPGREQLSWPLYHALAGFARYAGLSHVSFNIPEGAFACADIYGQYVLYEHGVGVSVNETAMRAHKIKRSEQLQKHITYFRMGDKHTVCAFNSGQYVVNGAFFGATGNGVEYSEIAGYSSVPAQWMGFHVPRHDNRFTLYDSFVMQFDHIS